MAQKTLRLLLIGDVIGRPGRHIVQHALGRLRRDLHIDCVVANCENVAGGSGVTVDTADSLFMAGVDVLTSGNHVWRKAEAVELLNRDHRVLRPANYPQGAAGTGSTVVETDSGFKVGVLNLMGRVFMQPIDCPFQVADKELQRLKAITPIIVVDMHAEATSEKVAMGWHLDGRVSCVFGTHTHVPTADERILPSGTATITDVGMTGPYDSVIGRDVAAILQRFKSGLGGFSEVASENVQLRAALVEVEASSGRAVSIQRLTKTYDDA